MTLSKLKKAKHRTRPLRESEDPPNLAWMRRVFCCANEDKQVYVKFPGFDYCTP